MQIPWDLLSLAGWPHRGLIALFLLGTIFFLALSSINRAKIDAALKKAHSGNELGMWDLSRGDASKALGEKRVTTPESLWTYDAEYLERYAREARQAVLEGGGTALSCYVHKVLRRWDTVFAAFLALFTGLFNFSASTVLIGCPFAGRVMLVLAGMGILYGVADVAENFKLARVLEQSNRLGEDEHVDAGEAAAANALTRIKIVALSLSVTGLAVFLILFYIMKFLRSLTPGAASPVKTTG